MIKELVFEPTGLPFETKISPDAIYDVIRRFDSLAVTLPPGSAKKINLPNGGDPRQVVVFATQDGDGIIIETPQAYIDTMHGNLKEALPETPPDGRRLRLSDGPVFLTSKGGTVLERIVYQVYIHE